MEKATITSSVLSVSDVSSLDVGSQSLVMVLLIDFLLSRLPEMREPLIR
jgi:hypothetical protein